MASANHIRPASPDIHCALVARSPTSRPRQSLWGPLPLRNPAARSRLIVIYLETLLQYRYPQNQWSTIQTELKIVLTFSSSKLDADLKK
jgi:hypothetical protein